MCPSALRTPDFPDDHHSGASIPTPAGVSRTVERMNSIAASTKSILSEGNRCDLRSIIKADRELELAAGAKFDHVLVPTQIVL